ncbi:MAG: periplasmic heavy metal sensor [Pseudolabrys sp.]
MSVAQFAPAALSRGSSRWLLLGSLALNLFFVGIAVAMAIRTPAAPTWDRDVFVRIDRIASTLPAPDADLLRGEVKKRRQALEDAQHQFFTAREQVHAALRRDPFSADDMRAAMAKTRAARQNFDQTLQGIFAEAASKMSNNGRIALADWPPNRKSPSKDR